MCRVSSKTEPPDAHARRKALVDTVRAEVDDAILVRPWMSRKHCAELPLLALAELLIRQARQFTVRDTVQAVFPDPRCHVPVFRVDDEVGVDPAEFRKIVVRLWQGVMSAMA